MMELLPDPIRGLTPPGSPNIPVLLSWDQSAGLFHLTVIATAGILLWLAVTGIERIRFRRQLYTQTPDALFGELCRAHRLSRGQRRLLTAISRQISREQCCRVFVDRRPMDQFSQAHPDEAADCAELARRLFSDPPR